MTSEEIQKAIEEAKVWVKIMEESQATREKYGKQVASELSLDLGNDAASARALLTTMEREIFGGVIGGVRARIENIERALSEKAGVEQ